MKYVYRVRRWWHLRRGHTVVTTPVRDYSVREGRYEFFFRPGWLCVQCRAIWPK